jgi:hypothetical protein
VMGTAGLSFLRGTEPVIATAMTQGSDTGKFPSASAWQLQDYR